MAEFQIRLPEKVNRIIRILIENGHEAYAVGGCVRDSLLGRVPEDWDINTSATPEEVKKLFRRTFDTGIEHGTVTVLLEKETFEVTTYRIDGKYEDNRHPKEVTFTRSLKEDLLRRDFTINAMAYNDKEGLIDIFNGRHDLKQKTIRCVGNAQERFGEDALRILRGVRFAAQLGFDIEDNTEKAMEQLAHTLCHISAERIQTELVKMLISPRPELLQSAYKLGITKQILPEFDCMMCTEQETPHHQYNVGEHTLHSMMHVRPDKVLRLTMLFHDMGKPEYKTVDEWGVAHFKKHALASEVITKQVMRRFKFDNDTLRKVSCLVKYHDYRMPAEAKYVRRAMNKISRELFPYYLEVREADVLAQSLHERESKLQVIKDTRKLYQEITDNKQCVTIKELDINGSDLIELGMSPGKEIGEALNQLLEIVIEHPKKNKKEHLIKEIFKN